MAGQMYGNYYQPMPQNQQVAQPYTVNQQPVPQPQQQQTSLQIQNGGFLTVPSEEVARNYPVAPGNSITFKIENAPYICTKTMGFSQLEQPIFEKYRLIKEEDYISQNVNSNDTEKVSEITEFKEIFKNELDGLHNEIESLKRQIKLQYRNNKKKDVEDK